MINRMLDSFMLTSSLLSQDYGDEGFNLSPDTIFNGDNARSVAFAPLRWGLKYQAARSALYAVGTLDFTSPYSEKLMIRRYKMRALTGFSADIADSAARLVDYFVPGSTSENQIFGNWLRRQMPIHRGGITKAEIRDLMTDGKGKLTPLGKEYSRGVVENLMYPKKRILQEIKDALGPSGNVEAVLGATEEAQKEFIEDFYQELRKTTKRASRGHWRNVGNIKVVTPTDILSRMGRTRKYGRKGVKLITPEGMIEDITRHGGFAKTMKAVGLTVGEQQPRLGIGTWFGMRRFGRIHRSASQALNTVVQERLARPSHTIMELPGEGGVVHFIGRTPTIPADRAKTIGKALKEVGDRADYRAMLRGTAGRIARWGGVGFIGLELTSAALTTGIQRVARFATQAGITLREMTRQDFGSGKILMTSRMATERQRAIEAMQNSGMNARMLLGTEAAMYHGQ